MTGLGDHNELIHVGSGGLGGDVADVLGFTDETLTGDPTALVSYSAGDLSVYASVTQAGHTFDLAGVDGEGSAYAVGLAYSMDAYTFSLGYESVALDEIGGTGSVDIKHLLLGADATFGQVTVKARYGNGDIDVDGLAEGDITQSALSATYSMDAVSVTAFVSQKSIEDTLGANLLSVDAHGIGVSYDLGGGASVVGGISRLEVQDGAAAAEDDTAFDLGLTFKF